MNKLKLGQLVFAALMILGLLGIAGGIGYMFGWRDAVAATISAQTAPDSQITVATVQGPEVAFKHTQQGWTVTKVFYHDQLKAIRSGWPGGIFVQTTYQDGSRAEMLCSGDLEGYVCRGVVGPQSLKEVHHLTLMPDSKTPVYLDLQQ